MIMQNPYVNFLLNWLIMLNINSMSPLLTCNLKLLLKYYVWVPKDTKHIHYH